jgi:hypothetical protein
MKANGMGMAFGKYGEKEKESRILVGKIERKKEVGRVKETWM